MIHHGERVGDAAQNPLDPFRGLRRPLRLLLGSGGLLLGVQGLFLRPCGLLFRTGGLLFGPDCLLLGPGHFPLRDAQGLPCLEMGSEPSLTQPAHAYAGQAKEPDAQLSDGVREGGSVRGSAKPEYGDHDADDRGQNRGSKAAQIG